MSTKTKGSRLSRITLLAVALTTLGAGEAAAQATATSSATATIITGIAISNTVGLDFGDVVPGPLGGTVVMTPAGVRSTTGDALLGSGASATAAAFTVTGDDGATYSITLPTLPETLASGVNTMTVDNFTSNPSGTGTLSGGSQTLNVGATLHVGAVQAIGTYTGSFDVTVAYN